MRKIGCGTWRNCDFSEPNSFAPYVDHSLDRERRLAPVQEHDFGVVLAEGETLRHEFTLKNSTDRPLSDNPWYSLHALLSALEPMPESVPPLKRR